MPKLKTRKGVAKRFKITKKGKILRRHSRMRHLLEWKSKKKKRKLRQAVEVSSADRKRLKQMLPRR